MKPTLTTEQRNELRKQKAAYEAHVNLIVMQDDCTPTVAQFVAYNEGPHGFNVRIGRAPSPAEKK